MNEAEVIETFRETGAILEGHFILSSGLHSPVFLQKANVFQFADKTEKLCRALAKKVKTGDLGPIDIIVSPALGGIIPGYETSRHMGLPAIWVEREEGQFQFRRFGLNPGARVLIVEDIVTTGLSSRETIEAVRTAGGEPVALACLIDRSAGEADVGIPLVALANYKVPAYAEHEMPAELAAIPTKKPGSRGLS